MSTARYQEAVVFAAAAHAASTRPPCKHPGNALLYYFLRYAVLHNVLTLVPEYGACTV